MLKTIFSFFAGNDRPKRPELPSRIQYVTYRVVREDVAAALYRWHHDFEAASREIAEFVEDRFGTSLLRIDRPMFKIDEDGRLHSVLFNGFMPTGWSGIPNTHWMAPQSAEATAEVNALPRAPSRKALHDLVEWPILETGWFPQAEQGIVRRVNRLVRPWGDGDSVYIDLPHPDNFAAFPRIAHMIAQWQKPAWLLPRDEPESHPPRPQV